MPEFTTHYLFGKSILKNLDSKTAEIINDNIAAFNWGLQGPDLLFYSNILRDNGRMARSGSALHHTNPDAVFSVMLEYILRCKNHTEYNSLCSYLYGFICHYALDSTTHPYVYSMIEKMDGQITTKRHVQIESEIGSLMYRRMTGMPVSGFKIYENYSSSGAFAVAVSKMYTYIIKTLFNKTVSEKEIATGFSFCLFINRLTYFFARCELDGKTKTALLKGAKAMIRKLKLVNSFIKSDEVETDTLNMSHREWYNLNEPEIKFDYSFVNLFDIAQNQALELFRKCDDMLNSENIEPLGLTGTFDNGEPVKSVRIRILSQKNWIRKLIKSRA